MGAPVKEGNVGIKVKVVDHTFGYVRASRITSRFAKGSRVRQGFAKVLTFPPFNLTYPLSEMIQDIYFGERRFSF